VRQRLFGTDAVAPPRTRIPSVFLPLDEDPGVEEVDEVVVADPAAETVES
jgi:CDP-diacylglycerol--serine O-phosphatidyltransferase